MFTNKIASLNARSVFVIGDLMDDAVSLYTIEFIAKMIPKSKTGTEFKCTFADQSQDFSLSGLFHLFTDKLEV
jgi:hypothetical protein